MAQYTATVQVTDGEADTVKPVIELDGAATMYATLGVPFTDPGSTCWDDVDGDLSNQIEISGTVDHLTPGPYTLTHSGPVDSSGNVAEPVTRTVIVIESIVNDSTSNNVFRFSF